MFLLSLLKACKKAGPVILVSLFLLLACGSQKPDFVQMTGLTMGTSYHITAKLPATVKQEEVEAAITARLLDINQSMSTYISDSEISLFNQAQINQWQAVSDDFLQVLTVSRQVYEQSNAAFNPSIGPLVDLWGFGPKLSVENFQQTPAAELIADKLLALDFTAIEQKSGKIQKRKAVRLDFSAVAKGFAVDALAELLQGFAVKDYMVEIGGEVKTAGLSPRNKVWRIGIEQPGNLRGKTFKALELNNASVATSGDYRNYLEIDGKRYSHTINPVTGYPVDHKLSSVTVIANSVALADAWATAIMVLGQDKGFEIASQQQLAVYMIYRENDQYAVKYTESMKAFLSK